MNLATASGSERSSSRIQRVRNLLSFDRSFLHPAQQAHRHVSHGQITLAFAGGENDRANPVPNLRLVGFDEAGRGSLAGPVTVGCVQFDWSDLCLPEGDFRDAVLESYADLNDSKQVTKKNRESLYDRILAEAHCGIGCASAPEIDRLGIVKACSLAANRAYGSLLDCTPGHGLGASADIGLFDRGLSLGEEDGNAAIPFTVQITKGDAKSFHIAAASILAKVWRDAILCDLDTRAEIYGFAETYGFAEAYGFASHKGYGSAAHIAAIRQHGPSRFHRRTFLSRVLKKPVP